MLAADDSHAGARAGVRSEALLLLTADIDDSTAEYLAAAADLIRAEGALDVYLSPVTMKKGRLGTRLEALVSPDTANRIENALFSCTTTLGVRRTEVERISLPRHSGTIEVLGHVVSVKWVTLPDGTTRAKPEYEDVRAVALATGLPPHEVAARAAAVAQATGRGV